VRAEQVVVVVDRTLVSSHYTAELVRRYEATERGSL